MNVIWTLSSRGLNVGNIVNLNKNVCSTQIWNGSCRVVVWTHSWCPYKIFDVSSFPFLLPFNVLNVQVFFHSLARSLISPFIESVYIYICQFLTIAKGKHCSKSGTRIGVDYIQLCKHRNPSNNGTPTMTRLTSIRAAHARSSIQEIREVLL